MPWLMAELFMDRLMTAHHSSKLKMALTIALRTAGPEHSSTHDGIKNKKHLAGTCQTRPLAMHLPDASTTKLPQHALGKS